MIGSVVRCHRLLSLAVLCCSALAVTALVAAGPVGAYRFTTLDPPGAVTSAASGINEQLDIVGDYQDASGSHGYLLNRGASKKQIPIM